MSETPTNEVQVPIKDLAELVPLKDFVHSETNPLSPNATRHLLRRGSRRPEFREAVICLGRKYYIHLPTFVRAFERYRATSTEAA